MVMAVWEFIPGILLSSLPYTTRLFGTANGEKCGDMHGDRSCCVTLCVAFTGVGIIVLSRLSRSVRAKRTSSCASAMRLGR